VYDLVEQNLRHCFRVMTGGRPHSDIREYPGLTIASAGVTFQMFNAAFLAPPLVESLDDLKRRMALAAIHFQQRRIKWSFWCVEDMIAPMIRSRAFDILDRAGLDWAVELPGMIADEILPQRYHPAKLEIVPVHDHRERLAFCEIGSVCFRVPLPWFREIFTYGPLWDSGFRAWNGYANGEPVVTAAAVVSGEVVGIYNVATLPTHRRNGYAETILRHTLDQLRTETGIHRSILQSTDYGYQLYRGMGYRQVTTVTVFTSR
jgi:hypothetical protein